jgi:BirA family biotin operon repressor/biotin-[acetyl-CoA-carboxylase] ligase
MSDLTVDGVLPSPSGVWASAARDPRVSVRWASTRRLRAPVLVGTVGSTQDELRRLIDARWASTPVADDRTDDVGVGTVVIAEQQTGGRGRGGRAWDDDARPGASLALSVLLAPSDDPRRTGLVPAALGLGVHGAVTSLDVGLEARIGLKWPNDVIARDEQGVGRKLAGLLVERTTIAGRDVLIAGIGINVDQRHLDRSSAELAQRTSVAELLAQAAVTGVGATAEAAGAATSDLHGRLLASLVTQLDAALVLLDEDPGALLDRCRDASDTLGRTVRVDRPSMPSVTGHAAAIDDEGRLVLVASAGQVTILAGTLRDADDPHGRRQG